LYELKLGQL